MRISAVVLITMLAIGISLSQTPGKRMTEYGFEVDLKPAVYYDVYLTYEVPGWSPRINFVIKIQNDLFQFTRNDSGKFGAAYFVSITIKAKESENALFSRVWRQEISVETFEETNSRQLYQVSSRRFDPDLASGEYMLFLEVTDANTNKGYGNRRPLKLPPPDTDGITHSEIVLLDPEDSLSAEIHIGPEDLAVEFNKDYEIYAEFATPDSESVHMTTELIFLRKGEEKTVWSDSGVTEAGRGKTVYRNPLSRKYLNEGRHILKLTAEGNAQQTTVRKLFNVVWYTKPVYLYKADLALRPMRYILTPEEVEIAEDLPYDELEEWMAAYWKERDPTPETPFNEIKYEFFNRVSEVNRLYDMRFSEGWETDRGHAYLLYGKPDRIRKNRYATESKPYEVWFYDEIKRKLTFIDKNEDEDYELVGIEDLEGNTE